MNLKDERLKKKTQKKKQLDFVLLTILAKDIRSLA